MPIKRLLQEDIDQLRDLANDRSSIKGVMTRNASTAYEYNFYWLSAMERYYLVGNDTHFLYGYYDDNNQLLSCLGWRCDLPWPWNDGWCVGHLKTRQGLSVKNTGMVELWKAMFDFCESQGLKRWHMLIPEQTKKGYQSVADRYFKDIDSTYYYEWSVIIPPNTQPDIDWVWGTMGRRTHLVEMRLRTGTKKCV